MRSLRLILTAGAVFVALVFECFISILRGPARRVNPADTALTLRYDVFPDGKTFIAVQGDVAPANKRLTVLLNGVTAATR